MPMPPKVSIEAWPDLAEFLESFAGHFLQSEGGEDLERYCSGSLLGLARRNPPTIGQSISGGPIPSVCRSYERDPMGKR